ncbi:hypothetical protein A245_26503, partial [Pseudomonas syringae pv. actinidiae ICMP 19096]
GGHFERGEHAPAQILRQLDGRVFAQQQYGKELIPCRDGLKKPLQAARSADADFLRQENSG